jgi:hypothetical protein
MRFPAVPRWTTLFVAALLAACRTQVTPPPPAAYSGSSTVTSEARRNAFRAATDSLSRQINAPRDSIAGVSQDEMTWNDSCLGCPQTGEKCAQVLTPGYRILLRVSDATYEYHTDLGGRTKLCSQSPAASSYASPGYPTPLPTPYPR